MKFKINDEAKVVSKSIGNPIDSLALNIGDIVTINGYSSKYEYYYASCEGKGICYYFIEKDLAPMGISIL